MLANIYDYFTLRQWKIIHAALKFYEVNHRRIDGRFVTPDELFDIRVKLPSESDQ
jgi:hypothetical protein